MTKKNLKNFHSKKLGFVQSEQSIFSAFVRFELVGERQGHWQLAKSKTKQSYYSLSIHKQRFRY